MKDDDFLKTLCKKVPSMNPQTTLLILNLPSHATEFEFIKKFLKKFDSDASLSVVFSRLEGQITNEGFGYLETEIEELRAQLLSPEFQFSMKNYCLKFENFKPVQHVRTQLIKEKRRLIHVSKLKQTIDEIDLKTYFSKFGKLQEVKLGRNFRNGKSLGFATVKFFEEESVEKVLFKKEHLIKEKKILCSRKLLKSEIDNMRPIEQSKYKNRVLHKLNKHKNLLSNNLDNLKKTMEKNVQKRPPPETALYSKKIFSFEEGQAREKAVQNRSEILSFHSILDDQNDQSNFPLEMKLVINAIMLIL